MFYIGIFKIFQLKCLQKKLQISQVKQNEFFFGFLEVFNPLFVFNRLANEL